MPLCHRAVIITVALCLSVRGVSEAGEKAGEKKQPFSISKETTRVTGPVDKEGFIDYAAALNDRLAAGVTKDNNAVALLCQVYGPKPEGARVTPEFYKRLGIAEPPEPGAYFRSLDQFLAGKQTPDERARLHQALEEATGRPWKTDDLPQVAAWLKAMELPIAQGIEATRRPKYYYPLIPQTSEHGPLSVMSCLVPHVQKNRELANALALRAMLHLGEGRSDAAWQDLVACHRLARLSSQGGTLIENLVGIALEHVVGDGTLAFLEHAKLNAKGLRRCWAEWQGLPGLKPARANIDLGERFMVLEAALMMQRYGPNFLENFAGVRKGGKQAKPAPMTGVAWDPALKNINRFFDRMDAALKEADYRTRWDELRKIDRDLRELKAKIGDPGLLSNIAGLFATPEQRGERIGNILICLLLPAVTKVQEAQERTEQLQRNIDTAFALAAYRLDHGMYPKTLADLSPKYLMKSPTDLFTGKPLSYRPQDQGYVLYSFGLNGQDDEARTRDDNPPGDDLVVRMPRPARRQ